MVKVEFNTKEDNVEDLEGVRDMLDSILNNGSNQIEETEDYDEEDLSEETDQETDLETESEPTQPEPSAVNQEDDDDVI